MITDLSLLLPKGMVIVYWVAGIVTALGVTASYHDTITLGSVVIAAIVAILGGIFTLRNNLKSFWRDLAEERKEQIESLETRLKEATEALVTAQVAHTKEMSAFAEEQREVRHQLKSELASSKLLLEAEKAKHDYSQIYERLTGLEMLFSKRQPIFEKLSASSVHQEDILAQILEVLSRPS